MLTVGSSAAISTSSSFSSCFSFDFARVAVLARALFLAMNSSRCFILASTPAFDAFFVLAPLILVLPMGVDLPRVHCQFSAREFERVVAGRFQKRSIVRDDQAGLLIMPEEVLEQDLGAQVEKVRGFVEQQQVRRMEQECRELHPRLPAAGEHGDRAFEIASLQFKLGRHLAAFPVGLLAVAHQELEHGFARQKRIVLAQVTQSQLGMANHLAAVQLIFADQDLEERALAGAISADKADLHVIGNRDISPVQKRLPAKTFVCVSDL